MIKFDKNGNPQPEGIQEFKYSDFKIFFVENFDTSISRKQIFEKYEEYVSDFRTQITLEFKTWVNGSYTTSKIDPNDIDVVNIVKHSDELNNRHDELKAFLTVGGSKEKYLVDGYFIPVYPTDDPRYVYTQQNLTYWADWFGHDREKRAKALIELSFV